MKTHPALHRLASRLLLLLSAAALLGAPAGWTQVPVDDNGNPIPPMEAATAVTADATEAGPLMTPEELAALVGPIALYPDDLLAIVLPASTYPLEVVQAARFLEDHQENDRLEPDESWDDSIVALLNYPEVLEMMNDDIDWTWRLGEAVANQQPDVIAAIEAFRDRAYAAGNLKTDEYQTVSENDDGIIEIEPVSEEIIYVPYYEPERVVVYQPRPVYYYYPRPYPVYYYPYPHGYNFYSNYFWGVTTAFSIGWTTHNLHVFHHSYWGHPYYGHTYYPHWWYRRPSITVYNTWYGDHRSERTRDHYARGDIWRPRHTGGARPGFHRSRADYYRDRRRENSSEGYRDRSVAEDNGRVQLSRRPDDRPANNAGRSALREEDSRSGDGRQASGDRTIRFREREGQPVAPSASRQRADVVDRGAPITTRREVEQRRPTVTERGQQPVQRTSPRSAEPSESPRRGTVDPPRFQQEAVRREQAARTPVSRVPAARAETPRQGVVTRAPTPTRSAPARTVPQPASSPPRSVTRPAVVAPRSVSRPAASAPRSVPPRAASAPRAAPQPASRPSSSSSSVRRPAASSNSPRRVRDR